MEVQETRMGASAPTKSARRLKPEIAAQWAAQRRDAELQQLYSMPVEKLSPDDIAKMKAAFLRG